MTTAAHSLEVNVPAEQAYLWWRGLINLPTVLPDVESVDMAETPQLTRWRVRDRSGRTIECQAKITEDIPNAKIAWVSPDAAAAGLPESAEVRFDDHGETTGVEVTMEYGDGPVPPQQAESILTAFKQKIETAPAEHRHVERI